MPDLAVLDLAIKTGEWDEHLIDLHNAIVQRFTYSDTAKRWRVEWEAPDGTEVAVTEDDLTIDEAAVLERRLGMSWGVLNPLTSAQQCREIIRLGLTERSKHSEEHADKQLAELKMIEAVECISEYQVQPAPLDSGGSTTTS